MNWVSMWAAVEMAVSPMAVQERESPLLRDEEEELQLRLNEAALIQAQLAGRVECVWCSV
jgi:hypothetical protein